MCISCRSGYSGYTSASQPQPHPAGLPPPPPTAAAGGHNHNSNNYLPPPYSYVNDAVSYQSLNRPPAGAPSAPSLHSSGKIKSPYIWSSVHEKWYMRYLKTMRVSGNTLPAFQFPLPWPNYDNKAHHMSENRNDCKNY